MITIFYQYCGCIFQHGNARTKTGQVLETSEGGKQSVKLTLTDLNRLFERYYGYSLLTVFKLGGLGPSGSPVRHFSQ